MTDQWIIAMLAVAALALVGAGYWIGLCESEWRRTAANIKAIAQKQADNLENRSRRVQ